MGSVLRTIVFSFVLALTVLTSSHVSAQAPSRVSADQLEAAIRARRNDVPEFKFIAEFARKNGIRVWLFGGTAASFAHYAKWDLQRKAGDTRFQPNRFDYDYTNIYRSNQDLDIVIDGSGEKATELQNLLARTFAHLQGSKSAWEVRLLRQNYGTKEAILGNADFANQHTDSHSVGMIELTESTEPVMRDLRDWMSTHTAFVDDVVRSKLHYYFSTEHELTARFRAGLNPSIISVVRYYIKAFQFELAIDPVDEPTLKRIIDAFDPTRLTTYEKSWLDKNVPKLIQNAVNIEYARKTLERVGLFQKLSKTSDARIENSASWWLNREPLRTLPVGAGSGKTARDHGIDVVAHETQSFEAYESITRAHTGQPNVLISRDNVPGEFAAYGNGFYTKKGRQGARGTNITIRFTVDPDAREGSDFHKHGDFIVFTNKAALRVIQESLQWGFRDYVRFLSEGKTDANERAMFEKLRRRMTTRMMTDVSAEDIRWFDDVVSQLAKNETGGAELRKEWLEVRQPFSNGFSFQKILAMLGPHATKEIYEHLENPKTRIVRRTLGQHESWSLLSLLHAHAETLDRAHDILGKSFDFVPLKMSNRPSVKDLDDWIMNSRSPEDFENWFRFREPGAAALVKMSKLANTDSLRMQFGSSFLHWATSYKKKFTLTHRDFLTLLEAFHEPYKGAMETHRKTLARIVTVTGDELDSKVLSEYFDEIDKRSIGRYALAELETRSDLVKVDKRRAVQLLLGLVDGRIANIDASMHVIFGNLARSTGPVMTVTEYMTLVTGKMSDLGRQSIRFSLAEYADRVTATPEEMRTLDAYMMATDSRSSDFKAPFKLWIVKNQYDLAGKAEILERLMANDTEFVPKLLEAFKGFPDSIYEDPKIRSVLARKLGAAFNFNEFLPIFKEGVPFKYPDFMMELLGSMKSAHAASRFGLAVFDRPEWKARPEYLEKLILSLPRPSPNSYDWQLASTLGQIDGSLKDPAFSDYPRFKALLGLNGFTKRKMTVANLLMALDTEKKLIAEGKAPVIPKASFKRRYFAPRTCEGAFQR